jgi:thioredoxin 1
MAHPVEISDETFQTEVLEADTPVLVDFWAEWCAPCKMIAPVLDELSGEYDGKVKFTKVNVDDNPHMAQHYRVRGIPTLLVFSGGEAVDQIVGAQPKAKLKEVLDKAIA